MYLTRMRLDMTNRQTMKALVSPNLFHGAIEHAFAGERDRKLWRIDHLNGHSYLLLLSPELPNMTGLVQQFGCATDASAWETKDYSSFLDRIQPGTCWLFRLIANPTKSCPSIGSKASARGRVTAHISPRYQEQWLFDRAEKHGFTLAPDAFSVVHSQWIKFKKGSDGGRTVSLLSVTYEGVLTVTDSELFRKTLTDGLGRGKAYGMGLLTVVQQR